MIKITIAREREIEPVSLRNAFGARHQGRHRIDDQHVDRARTDEGVRDLQRLLAGIRLGDQQIVYIDAELAGIGRVERVLGIDEGTSPAAALRLGDDV